MASRFSQISGKRPSSRLMPKQFPNPHFTLPPPRLNIVFRSSDLPRTSSLEKLLGVESFAPNSYPALRKYFQLEMRRVLRELSGPVCDDIERVLSLRHRGCSGVELKKDTTENLEQMKLGMERAERFIKKEKNNLAC